MATSVDPKAYFQSIGRELSATRNRVRNLIGDAHWASDGRHKEWLVRNVLLRHAPGTVLIGHGFVHVPQSWLQEFYCTHQIDVLAICNTAPILFREGDFLIVTPDTVRGVIEVKTNPDKSQLRDALLGLAEDIGQIRRSFCGPHPIAGLIAFENTRGISDEELLQMMQESSQGDPSRVVNSVALGEDWLFRFEEDRKDEEGAAIDPGWQSYNLVGKAHPCFLTSTVLAISGPERQIFGRVWDPIAGNPAESRRHYVSLDGSKNVISPGPD